MFSSNFVLYISMTATICHTVSLLLFGSCSVWTGTDGTSLDSVKWDGRTLAKQQQRKDTRTKRANELPFYRQLSPQGSQSWPTFQAVDVLTHCSCGVCFDPLLRQFVFWPTVQAVCVLTHCSGSVCFDPLFRQCMPWPTVHVAYVLTHCSGSVCFWPTVQTVCSDPLFRQCVFWTTVQTVCVLTNWLGNVRLDPLFIDVYFDPMLSECLYRPSVKAIVCFDPMLKWYVYYPLFRQVFWPTVEAVYVLTLCLDECFDPLFRHCVEADVCFDPPLATCVFWLLFWPCAYWPTVQSALSGRFITDARPTVRSACHCYRSAKKKKKERKRHQRRTRGEDSGLFVVVLDVLENWTAQTSLHKRRAEIRFPKPKKVTNTGDVWTCLAFVVLSTVHDELFSI